ncbi:oxidoreductase [Streptomyces sp. NPDC049906]|uniref:oxidoreductase n=1 Tax=Streptomyces sp. NPDC049906 TaxID=3155656 RepID=UPI0034268105
MSGWSEHDIPDQHGRTAIVTGANSGLGHATARALARRGARVVLACRSAERGTAARDRLRAEVPGADVEFAPLDLADLESVRGFADAWRTAGDRRLDLLVNNAGVMALPHRLTADGFEMQFGVNHLGHFALTGLLLPSLLATPGSRIVTVSSFMHHTANIDIHDLNSTRGYRRWTAYGRSKTANLLFVHELARRLAARGGHPVATAAHPGYARTNLQTAAPRMEGRRSAERVIELGNLLLAQSAEAGALPTLYAATAPGVRPDSFTGPAVLAWRGAPAPARRARWTTDDRASGRLWEESVRLTGVTWPELATDPDTAS